jgi:hypothetical protein
MTDILKAVILQPKLCVCFAGNVGRAQKVIEYLPRATSADDGFDLEEILAYLLKENRDGIRAAKDGVDGTDFIVATLKPSPSFIR